MISGSMQAPLTIIVRFSHAVCITHCSFSNLISGVKYLLLTKQSLAGESTSAHVFCPFKIIGKNPMRDGSEKADAASVWLALEQRSPRSPVPHSRFPSAVNLDFSGSLGSSVFQDSSDRAAEAVKVFAAARARQMSPAARSIFSLEIEQCREVWSFAQSGGSHCAPPSRPAQSAARE